MKQPGRVSGPPGQPGILSANPGSSRSPTEETNEHIPGSGGATALGGARGRERLLRGACARSTAAKM